MVNTGMMWVTGQYPNVDGLLGVEISIIVTSVSRTRQVCKEKKKVSLYVDLPSGSLK